MSHGARTPAIHQLVDPDPEVVLHLASCSRCRVERKAYLRAFGAAWSQARDLAEQLQVGGRSPQEREEA
jgi:hypothetical protein